MTLDIETTEGHQPLHGPPGAHSSLPSIPATPSRKRPQSPPLSTYRPSSALSTGYAIYQSRPSSALSAHHLRLSQSRPQSATLYRASESLLLSAPISPVCSNPSHYARLIRPAEKEGFWESRSKSSLASFATPQNWVELNPGKERPKSAHGGSFRAPLSSQCPPQKKEKQTSKKIATVPRAASRPSSKTTAKAPQRKKRPDAPTPTLPPPSLGNPGVANIWPEDRAAIESLFLQAAMEGHFLEVQKWVQFGVDLDCPGANGKTALHHAAEINSVAIICLLLDFGANPIPVSTKQSGGYTPLHIAAMEGHVESIVELFSAENDIPFDSHNRTPLHLATIHNKQSAVRMLLELGHGAEYSDETGRTARDWAESLRLTDLIESLPRFKKYDAAEITPTKKVPKYFKPKKKLKAKKK